MASTEPGADAVGYRSSAPPPPPILPQWLANAIAGGRPPVGANVPPPADPLAWAIVGMRPAPSGEQCAGWIPRAVAFLLDAAVVVLLTGLGYVVAVHDRLAHGPLPMAVLGGALQLLDAVLLIGLRGATPGMAAVGIRCVDAADGRYPVGIGRAGRRWLAAAVLLVVPLVGIPLDLLWPLWDRRKQTLHDKIAGTVVVKRF